MTPSEKAIRVCEIFGPTVQGEGALMGQQTVFVRTGGCDYRCSWCDTMYAVDPQYAADWVAMSAQEIMDRVDHLTGGRPMMVTLSGGNPAMQPLGPLLALGHKRGYRFALETQGSLARDWFADLDVLTLSPKPPSSGVVMDWDKLNVCIEAAQNKPQTCLKVVIFDEADYGYAQEVAQRYPQFMIYLQVGNHAVDPNEHADIATLLQRLKWLAERFAQDQWDNACVSPQLHVLTWGNERAV